MGTGSAVVAGKYIGFWVFIVAPVIGAVIAAVVWKYLFEDSSSPA